MVYQMFKQTFAKVFSLVLALVMAATLSVTVYASTARSEAGIYFKAPLYIVRFETNYASWSVPDQEVRHGDLVTRPPAAPGREGYEFRGWYDSSSFTRQWNFATDTVVRSMTLFGRWVSDETETPPPPRPPTGGGGINRAPGTGVNWPENYVRGPFAPGMAELVEPVPDPVPDPARTPQNLYHPSTGGIRGLISALGIDPDCDCNWWLLVFGAFFLGTGIAILAIAVSRRRRKKDGFPKRLKPLPYSAKPTDVQ